jgi:hypothetical protein
MVEQVRYEAHRAGGIDAFMEAIAQVESGGYYYARNPTSGAYGKYQIMPRNWRNWSGRVLGDQKARATPENQEIVAHWRISRLYSNRGSWRRVSCRDRRGSPGHKDGS